MTIVETRAGLNKRVGRCGCGQSLWWDQDRCICEDEMPADLPGNFPTIADASARRPVAVVREGRATVTGRLISVGGDRRTPNGKAKVQLPSGAFLCVPIWQVLLEDGEA